jgi:DNA-directed RNA polymerase subunit F
MIKNSEPLSMSEVVEYVKKSEEGETEIIGFINKFNKLKPKEARELKKEIEKLEMIKIKPEYAIKIIDVLPETAEELNKIFVDVSLDEDETKKILETIKKFK